MKQFFLYIFFCNSYCLYGQNVKIQTIRQINLLTKDVYIFPKIIIANSASASIKINNKLREEVLYTPANTPDKKIFNLVWRTADQSEVVGDLSYKVAEANSGIISLSISGQACGAYCEGFTQYFTFNAKTGNLLNLNDWFTNQGVELIINHLNQSKREKLLAQISEIQRLKSKTNMVDKDGQEGLTEMLTMYTSCLDKKANKRDASAIQLLFKNGSLYTFTERCSAHYNMVYDDLWTFKNVISLKSYRRVLTTFGLNLLK